MSVLSRFLDEVFYLLVLDGMLAVRMLSHRPLGLGDQSAGQVTCIAQL